MIQENSKLIQSNAELNRRLKNSITTEEQIENSKKLRQSFQQEADKLNQQHKTAIEKQTKLTDEQAQMITKYSEVHKSLLEENKQHVAQRWKQAVEYTQMKRHYEQLQKHVCPHIAQIAKIYCARMKKRLTNCLSLDWWMTELSK